MCLCIYVCMQTCNTCRYAYLYMYGCVIAYALFCVHYFLYLCRDQRRWYHYIRQRAETDWNFMSIIDGMDQNSTQLPHTKWLQKTDSNYGTFEHI